MIWSPSRGTKLKFPYFVHLIVDSRQLAFGPAKAGRSFVWRSRFRSCPVVILNGGPVFATTNGLSTTFHHGKLTVPNIVKRWRTSKVPLPNSSLVSYEFIGNSGPPWPSVSFVLLLRK